MKKLAFSLLISLLTLSASAQKWIDLGLKGSWGPNILLNSNVFDDKDFNHRLSFGYDIGGKIGLNFGENHEVTFDVMSSNFNQKYDFNIFDSISGSSPLYQKKFSMKTLDFLLMYRHNKDGRYFEIGPKYSMVKSATGSNEYIGHNDGVIKDNIVDSYVSAVLGFGSYLIGTDNFGITFGARFSYTFTDLISPVGKEINYPSGTSYDSYKPSHPFTAMIVMEFNYDLGYIAKANCGERRKVIFF
jgi:hypothetical protein